MLRFDPAELHDCGVNVGLLPDERGHLISTAIFLVDAGVVTSAIMAGAQRSSLLGLA
jgi:hypothetical protein